jgi:4-hydroxy-tetrahydrodipicolinate synthase
MFTGLSAFPLTPLAEDQVDERSFVGLVEHLAGAGVDSIGALGSTGSYAYLSRTERARVAQLAVASAGDTPVMVGIGGLRTRHVLEYADDAQSAGASAVLLAPLSYQTLTDDDVFGLFDDVTRHLSVPLVVYENPVMTRFVFSDELYAAIGRLPGVASVKIPGVPLDPADATARVQRLRHALPASASIGVSGDAFGAAGLAAGCDAWYSVIAGTIPRPVLEIARAARSGDAARAAELSVRLQPLWDLFAAHGSLRVAAAIAESLGLVGPASLPLPIRGLDRDARERVSRVIDELDLRR